MNGDIVYHETKGIPGEFDSGLWWIEGDSGSWDGPSTDWISHREKILGQVKDFQVCVQAGGNLGLYPAMLGMRFQRVYTFEPHPTSFRCLMRNVEPWRNVYPINAALSNKNGLCSVTMDFSDNMGMNRTEFSGKGYIPTFTIDQLELDRCDLIWLDIEGAEENAVVGALRTIKRHRPIIALETVSTETANILESLQYDNVGRSISDSVFVPRI